MAKYDYDMIAIGGGAAGLTASTFAGQSAAKTLLIEKEEKLGGDCLHYGCVPSKSLIKSGYAYHVMRQAEKYGLPKVDLPPVDFTKIRDRIKSIIDTIQTHDEPEYLKKHFNVETRFGSPRFVDAHTIELNGEKITSKYFVIATGSAPFVPPIEGLAEIPYLTNMKVFSLDRLPESMLVLGGGPIGMEMAQSFARLGTKVTLIEAAPHVLAREDEDVSETIEKILMDEGVVFKLSTKAVKASMKDGLVCLAVEKNGKTEVLEAEEILIATGRRPNLDGLDLEKAGVQYTKRGISVDAKMRTSTKNIYACGDINGSFPFTHVAAYESVVAVTNAILKIPKKADYTNVPWVTYIDPQVASIGYNERSAKEAGIEYQTQIEYFNHNDRAMAEGETNGYIKVLIGKKGKVIGVQIVSYHAGDLISEWIPILNGKSDMNTLMEAIHPYPTMAEISKLASTNFIVKGIPAWTKPFMKALFGYQGKIS